MSNSSVLDLAELIRDVPDFPEPGIVFKDIAPLLGDAKSFTAATQAMAAPWRDAELSSVVGIEARGFVLGAVVARELGLGFVPVRKAGKLPGPTISQRYGLEYGDDAIEIHDDAIAAGDRVLIVDDVLATGGTAAAATSLIDDLGGVVAGYSFLLELTFLDGRSRLPNAPVHRLIEVAE